MTTPRSAQDHKLEYLKQFGLFLADEFSGAKEGEWRCAIIGADAAASVVEAIAHISSLLSWQPFESAPRDGTPFRAYGPSFVHADFNPWGSVEACFDGERFIGAEWDGQHDIWTTVFLDGRATHWQPFPDPSVMPDKR